MTKELVTVLLFGAITTGTFASEEDGVYAYKLGQYDIYMLVEGEREGNTNIIPGAGSEILGRFIPPAGFKHSTNCFLIKAPGQNVLIDTGMGVNNVILEKVIALGVQPAQLNAILLTHLHGDHLGTLQKDGKTIFPNAKVYLDAREYEYFTKTHANQGVITALAPYGSNLITFEGQALGAQLKEILPGISPIASYGHTPGHCSFLIENGGAKFLVAGDFLHIALVQFPYPDISATYDMDQKAAAASRRELADYAAKNKIPIGGMHIVYPGVGNVEADGSGFRFIPFK